MDLDDEDATAQAFAAIEQKLKRLTSPQPGNNNYDSYYQMDALQWIEQELKPDENEKTALPVKTPKRTPLLERAGTPVMSNSSLIKSLKGMSDQQQHQQQSRSNYGLNDNDNDDDEVMEDEPPMPMQTPLQRKFRVSDSKPNKKDAATTDMISNASLKQSIFRRHHDALWNYLVAKRSINNRMELERQERALDDTENSDSNAMMIDNERIATASSLSREESRVEVEYCKSLCKIGYGNNTNVEEGHFWDLLATLRKLNLSALIWDDDSTSVVQNASTQAFFLQQLTTKLEANSGELIELMHAEDDETSPLVLQRKDKLLKWIQSCLDLEARDLKSKLPSKNASAMSPSPCHPDDPTLPSLLSEMDSSIIKTLMQVCLGLVLEGKVAEARELARSYGQFWRAAAWVGGEPPGYKSSLRDDTKTLEWLPVGNPDRFLWKRQIWKVGRKLLLQQNTDRSNEEAAIYSILGDDTQNALDNPCIRSSWTRSLCVLLLGVRGRTQDEVLYKHNLQRRRNGTIFPGHEYEAQENEQLMHTAQLSTMTEAKMISILENNPFLKESSVAMGRFSYQSAIMAFVVGKSAILDLCERETASMVARLQNLVDEDEDEHYVHQDWEGVRFLTHLTLFLDSLQGSSTPVVCKGITDQKNAILFEYVKYLGSRPDLWHMITLYISFLPEARILEYFPTVLARVLDDSERHSMIGQIREFAPALELPLLRRVVRLSLLAPGADEQADAIKCNSLYWLLENEEHYRDALVCANILLREFFLDEEEDKMEVAAALLRDHLPEGFLEDVQAYGGGEYDAESDSCGTTAMVSNAITEHLAYMSYLEAYSTFERWKEKLKETPSGSSKVDNYRIPNYSNLSDTEKSIAGANSLRTWIKETKKDLEQLLGAAEDALSSWHNVLTHPGGWLSFDDDEPVVPATEEEQKRRADMTKIRSQYLVLATGLYHQVCEETASWLSKTLLREAKHFGFSRDEVLERLCNNHTKRATPEYWYQHALDLAILVATDTNGIHKAFPPGDLQELITKLGETAVSKLMNNA